MKNYLVMMGMTAVICGCSTVNTEKVTEVSKWTLKNTNGCWSLSSNDKRCSKMIKVLNTNDCKCTAISEAQACVSLPPDIKKEAGSKYYRVEITDTSGNKKIYWHNTNQLTAK